MDPVTLALLGGTALASGGLNYAGSRAAAGAQGGAASTSGMLGFIAQQQAIQQAREMAEKGAEAGREFYGKGAADVKDFYGKGTAALEDYYGRGTRALEDYYGKGTADIRDFYGKGTTALEDYYGKGARSLEDYYGKGTSALADYYGRGRADILGQGTAAENIGREFYGQGVAAQGPYTTAGAEATNRLAALYGVGGDYTKQPTLAELQMDPGYEFRRQQGEQALQRSIAAGLGGASRGGGALKAMADYSQGLASQEYGNAYNRFMANREAATRGLQNLSGTGAGAAGTVSNLAGSMGNALAGGRFNIGANLSNAATTTGGNIGQGAFNVGANLANAATTTGGNIGQGAFNAGANLANVATTTGGNIGQGAFNTGANIGNASTTAGANLANLASNAGGTVAGAYTGAIPTLAGITSANPYGAGMENAAAARASGYVGGTSALSNALNSGMGNVLAYNMMGRMYPSSAANRNAGGGYVYGMPDASNFGAGFSPGFMGAPTYGARSYGDPNDPRSVMY